MKLSERARAVRTCDDLVAFLEALSADHGANKSTWTNTDLASFLAAMAAWSEDMEGFYENAGRISPRSRHGAFWPSPDGGSRLRVTSPHAPPVPAADESGASYWHCELTIAVWPQCAPGSLAAAVAW